MRSFFWQRMENDHGDLADIVRASGGGAGSAPASSDPISEWQFPAEPTSLPSGIDNPASDFGDPFTEMRDPWLHELGSVFFSPSNSGGLGKMNMEEGDGSFMGQKILGEEMKRPSNIFSRMLQISPNPKMAINSSPTGMAASPRGRKASPLEPNEMVKAGGSMGCSVENGGLQIPSPRTPGVKRRKSQAKKVVCIPAPAAANTRPTGEVVPSDLWAWRKYGQKPIKGSPYPRGYYRCSSSKGCSARKQVERSRTDPNMLVITYTSEHNHPWPTQRNALAGSTRSPPVKTTAASKATSASTPTQKPAVSSKEEQKENNNEDSSAITTMKSGAVKEEMGEIEKPVTEMEGRDFTTQGFHPNYTPVLPPDSNQSDDPFADLGELDPDPLNLMFAEGFGGGKPGENQNKAALDPFTLFDWRS